MKSMFLTLGAALCVASLQASEKPLSLPMPPLRPLARQVTTTKCNTFLELIRPLESDIAALERKVENNTATQKKPPRTQ